MAIWVVNLTDVEEDECTVSTDLCKESVTTDLGASTEEPGTLSELPDSVDYARIIDDTECLTEALVDKIRCIGVPDIDRRR